MELINIHMCAPTNSGSLSDPLSEKADKSGWGDDGISLMTVYCSLQFCSVYVKGHQ